MAATDQKVGKHAYAFFSKETTWGTAVSPTKDFGLVQSTAFSGSNNLFRAHTIGTRGTQFIDAGNFDASGSLDFIIQHGRFLELLLASASAETTTSSDTVHAFNTLGNINPFTCDIGTNAAADTNAQLEGCLVTSGTISLGLNGYLRAALDFVAETLTNSTTANTTANSALAPLTSFMATLTTGTDGSEAAVVNVQSFDISFNNNVEKLWSLGSRIPTFATDTRQEIEFKFTAGFTDNTEMQLFLGSTTPNATSTPQLPSMVFTATNGITLGSGLRRLVADFNSCSYQTYGRPTNIDGFILQDFVGWAKQITNLTYTDNIANY